MTNLIISASEEGLTLEQLNKFFNLMLMNFECFFSFTPDEGGKILFNSTNSDINYCLRLLQRFQRILNRPDIIQFINTNSREINIKLREIMINYMNWGVSRTIYM